VQDALHRIEDLAHVCQCFWSLLLYVFDRPASSHEVLSVLGELWVFHEWQTRREELRCSGEDTCVNGELLEESAHGFDVGIAD